MRRYNRRRILMLFFLSLSCLGLIAGAYLWERIGRRFVPPPLPFLPTAPPYTPWPTPPVAETFDFPLLPAAAYGPLEHTRYGVHNPALGDRSNCFQDTDGNDVPFSALYHAGVDLFGVNDAGEIAWGQAAHIPVHAVADGVTVFVQDAGADGTILITEHLLADGGAVYAVYWHVDYVQVQPGQPVTRGQIIAVVRDLQFNSHLHWEMRAFRDGSDLFPAGTAGARGRCNGHVAGVGYTWDDDPARAHPDFYGYLDPIAFVEAHRP